MRIRHLKRAAIALGFTLAIGLLPSPARAQFPVFYGGEVLTPFGNRGSDGSYRYAYQNPRRRVATRGYVAAPASRYYFVPQGSYYTPFPGTTYAPTTRTYVRRRR